MVKEIVRVKGKNEIRWNRKTSNHILEDQSLMFKFLPLRNCKRWWFTETHHHPSSSSSASITATAAIHTCTAVVLATINSVQVVESDGSVPDSDRALVVGIGRNHLIWGLLSSVSNTARARVRYVSTDMLNSNTSTSIQLTLYIIFFFYFTFF